MIVAVVLLGDFPPTASAARTTCASQRSPLLKWGVYTCIRAIYGAPAGFAAAAALTLAAERTTQTHRRDRRPPLSWPNPSIWPSRFLRQASPALVLMFLRMCARCSRFRCASYADRRSSRGRVYAGFPVDAPALLPAGTRRPAALRSLPTATATRGAAGRRQPDLEKANLSFATALVTTLDARDQLYGWPLRGGRDLRTGHRGTDGASRRRVQQGHLAGLVHDSARSAFSWPVREARRAHARRASRDATPLGDRRTDPGEGRQLYRDRINRSSSTRRVDGGGYPDGFPTKRFPCSPGSSPLRMHTTR